MDTRLIARYLAGESNDAEDEKIKQWLEADPENEKVMEEFKRIWNASGEGYEDFNKHFDPRKDWSDLRERMLQEKSEDKGRGSSVSYLDENYSTSTKNRSAQLLRVAAIILVASLLGILSYKHLYQQPKVAEPTLREISMDKGQRGNITLSDGTKVILNAESKIILPNVFTEDKREITLKGEAFFDVTSNSDRPFIINTDQAVVEVLGTSLDVRSYPDDNSVQVVVKEGRVSLKSKSDCLKKDTVLNAGEVGELFVSENRIEKNKVKDFELYLGWRNGFLKFKNTPMANVARDLERKYDIDIRFENQQLKDLRLTAELKSRTIQHNMDVITTSLNMKYKMDQRVVTFYRDQE